MTKPTCKENPAGTTTRQSTRKTIHVQTPSLRLHPRPAASVQSRGHGPDDALSRHGGPRPHRADGRLLSPARQCRPADHRRHRARARGLGLCPHSRALHAGTRRGLAAGDGRGACRGRTNLRATDAHRQDLASAEHARGRAHYRALRRGPQRLHVDGPAGPAALPGTRRHDRIGHSTRDRSLCPRRGTGDQRGFRWRGVARGQRLSDGSIPQHRQQSTHRSLGRQRRQPHPLRRRDRESHRGPYRRRAGGHPGFALRCLQRHETRRADGRALHHAGQRVVGPWPRLHPRRGPQRDGRARRQPRGQTRHPHAFQRRLPALRRL
jgi:hypothetical protein